jgi:hypothetical protein
MAINTDDWQWYMTKAENEGILNVAVFKSDPYSFTERVGIKVDSGIELNEARNQAFWEAQENDSDL